MRSTKVKRAIDVAGSGMALVIGALPMAVVAVLVRLTMGRPVLFVHPRPGLGGDLFPLLKFRSMTNVTDEAGQPLPDEDRLTPVGQFLRRTSLDELPAFFNVLRGQMSLVGPRPLEARYLPRYNPRQARRHEVRPGITGLAQVSGRNALTWEEKFELDVWYVDNWSVGLDLWILLRTVGQVIRGVGVNQPGHATAGEFIGDATPDSPAAAV